MTAVAEPSCTERPYGPVLTLLPSSDSATALPASAAIVTAITLQSTDSVACSWSDWPGASAGVATVVVVTLLIPVGAQSCVLEGPAEPAPWFVIVKLTRQEPKFSPGVAKPSIEETTRSGSAGAGGGGGGGGAALSSFAIVPLALARPSVAFSGSERLSVKLSSGSTSVSPFSLTAICLLVSPGLKLSVPLVAW